MSALFSLSHAIMIVSSSSWTGGERPVCLKAAKKAADILGGVLPGRFASKGIAGREWKTGSSVESLGGKKEKGFLGAPPRSRAALPCTKRRSVSL